MESTTRDEQHDLPEGDERAHQLDAWCWCRPEIVRIDRAPDGSLVESQIVHRTEAPALVETA